MEERSKGASHSLPDALKINGLNQSAPSLIFMSPAPLSLSLSISLCLYPPPPFLHQMPNLREKSILLVKMMTYIEKRFPDDLELNAQFLDLVNYVYR